MKVLERSGIKVKLLNIIKAIYSKLIANITLNEEKLKEVPLNQEQEDCPLYLYLFNFAFEVLTRTVRQQKETKGIQIGNEEAKFLLFENDVTVYITDSKKSMRKLQ